MVVLAPVVHRAVVVVAEERRGIFGGNARVLGRCACLDVTPGLGEGPGQRTGYGLDGALAVAALQILLRVWRGAVLILMPRTSWHGLVWGGWNREGSASVE